MLLWFPTRLVQLLVRVVGEAEIVSPGVGQAFVGVSNLADNREIISLGFIIHRAAARERRYEVVVKPAGLLA